MASVMGVIEEKMIAATANQIYSWQQNVRIIKHISQMQQRLINLTQTTFPAILLFG